MSVQATVLAADSDHRVLRLVHSSLLEAGYTPITTSEPADAVHLVKAEKPDLVLLSSTLDAAEGVELIKRVLEVSDIPVIILSDHDKDEFVARAFQVGAEDYIVKPFSPRELTTRIRASLSKRSALIQTEMGKSFVLGELTIDYVEGSVSMGGTADTAHPHRVQAAPRVFEKRRKRSHTQSLAEKDLGGRLFQGYTGGAHLREEPATQAGRSGKQPHLHSHRTSRRLPDAEALETDPTGSARLACLMSSR